MTKSHFRKMRVAIGAVWVVLMCCVTAFSDVGGAVYVNLVDDFPLGGQGDNNLYAQGNFIHHQYPFLNKYYSLLLHDESNDARYNSGILCGIQKEEDYVRMKPFSCYAAPSCDYDMEMVYTWKATESRLFAIEGEFFDIESGDNPFQVAIYVNDKVASPLYVAEISDSERFNFTAPLKAGDLLRFVARSSGTSGVKAVGLRGAVKAPYIDLVLDFPRAQGENNLSVQMNYLQNRFTFLNKYFTPLTQDSTNPLRYYTGYLVEVTRKDDHIVMIPFACNYGWTCDFSLEMIYSWFVTEGGLYQLDGDFFKYDGSGDPSPVSIYLNGEMRTPLYESIVTATESGRFKLEVSLNQGDVVRWVSGSVPGSLNRSVGLKGSILQLATD